MTTEAQRGPRLPSVEGARRELGLHVRSLTHEVRDRQGTVALTLRDISLELYPGQIVALLGTSGCGKSTLLQLLAGLTRSSQTGSQKGTITVDGDDVVGPTEKVFLVFQDYSEAVFAWLTVRKNIALATRQNSPSVEEIAARLGIGELLDKHPRTLSGGEQQRVQLARALVAAPRYLLLDEPTASLDLGLRKDVLDLVAEQAKQKNFASLLVTHNLDEAVYIADHIYVLHRRAARDATLTRCEGFGRAADTVAEAQESKHFRSLYRAVHDRVFG